jgi:hypothetical protein
MTAAHTITTTRSTPRLYARQRQLLQLLDALGGTADKLDFQNLLFRYCEEPLDNAPYQFVPYQHGAFSFTADADCQKLVAFGLLADRGGWHLTDQGRTAVGRTTEGQLSAFVRHHRLRGDALVADTYRRFPFYATRSEHAERLLQGDGEALARIEAVRATRFDAALHTIGYEGHSVESYLNALLQNGITILCDVRRNPISRKYGFSKGTLSQTC